MMEVREWGTDERVRVGVGDKGWWQGECQG